LNNWLARLPGREGRGSCQGALDRFGSSYVYNDGGLSGVSVAGNNSDTTKVIVAGDAGWFMQMIAPYAARFWHTDSDKDPRFNMLFLDWHVGFVAIRALSTEEEHGAGRPDE
jgi:prepilin-type processing-associated H-X9-DG protein